MRVEQQPLRDQAAQQKHGLGSHVCCGILGENTVGHRARITADGAKKILIEVLLVREGGSEFDPQYPDKQPGW